MRLREIRYTGIQILRIDTKYIFYIANSALRGCEERHLITVQIHIHIRCTMDARPSSFMPVDQRKSGFTARQSSSTFPFKPYYQVRINDADGGRKYIPDLDRNKLACPG